MYISLSPEYAVRNDINGSYFIRIDGVKSNDIANFNIFHLPPFIGYLLTNIQKYPEDKVYSVLSSELGISESSIKHFIAQLIDNPEPKLFKYSDELSVILPARTLIRTESERKGNTYTSLDFNPYDDFVIRRPSFPTSVNLMITTSCNTDCIYCYADRNLRPEMSLSQIKDIIIQLKEGGCFNLAFTGGDIFARKDFLNILKFASEHGYHQFLSTKIPIKENMLVEIKNLGYDNFQFSLDSCDPEILNRHLHVQHDYINRIDEMLSSCDNLGLGIDIRTVITSINGTETRLTELYRFITRHKCIKRWDLTPYFYSPYKSSSYQEHRPNNEILRYMWNFSKREDLSIPIYLNKIGEDGYELQKYNNTEEFTENNMVCSGNCSCLSILANGICNVCEMLYEHPDFILGDAKSTPIYKIWNSDRAKKIYQLPQNEAPSNSACATCKDYNTCRLDFHKRICFSDIIKTGGSLYSPDPRCPKSKKHDFIL